MSKIKYPEDIEVSLKTWVKLARTFSTIYRKASENIKSFGLTLPQFAVIEALGHLGPLKVGDICNKMLATGGNMTLIIDNLEKLEMVRRVPSKKDRRVILIELTDKGQKIFDDYFIQHAEYIKNTFSILSLEEQKMLGSLLGKLGLGIVEREKNS